MDFNALSRADNSPASHSSSSPAGPREFERELMALHETPEYGQDLIGHELGAASRVAIIERRRAVQFPTADRSTPRGRLRSRSLARS
jgi:hypothetical protein